MALKRSTGKTILIAIPAGGCESGSKMTAGSIIPTPGVPVKIGADMIGVPDGSFSAGAEGNVTVNLDGVYGNQKLKTGDAPAIGDKLYLDVDNGYLTTTAGSLVLAGWAFSTATADNGAGVTIVDLKLRG